MVKFWQSFAKHFAGKRRLDLEKRGLAARALLQCDQPLPSTLYRRPRGRGVARDSLVRSR
jgi:hypothetical protein